MNIASRNTRAEADLRQRIAEDRAVVRDERRQIEAARRLRSCRESQESPRRSAIRPKAPVTKNTPRQPTRSPTTPAHGRAQQIAGHGREQQPADRDLALARPAPDRRPARTRSGTRRRRRARRRCAWPSASRNSSPAAQASVATPTISMQTEHQPRLAEHVGERAEHRLHQRIGQREGGRQQRGGRRLDVRGRRRSAE